MEVGAAMKEVGYSKNTRPHDVTNTKAWQDLMEEYLPDNELLRVHDEGLHAMKPINALVMIKAGEDGKSTTVYKEDQGVIEVEDHPTRAKFLDMAYKIKGKNEPNTQVNILNQGGDMNLEFFGDEK